LHRLIVTVYYNISAIHNITFTRDKYNCTFIEDGPVN